MLLEYDLKYVDCNLKILVSIGIFIISLFQSNRRDGSIFYLWIDLVTQNVV